MKEAIAEWARDRIAVLESKNEALVHTLGRAKSELARLREEKAEREADPTFRALRRENADLRAECGALRDSLLASATALAAERERAIEECAKVADGYAEGHDTATVIADEIRALAAPTAPQRAEGEG